MKTVERMRPGIMGVALVVAVASVSWGADWDFLDGFESVAGIPDIIYMDGFESVAGVTPGSMDDADPAWDNVVEISPEDIQVYDDPNGAYEGDQYGAYEGDQYVSIKNLTTLDEASSVSIPPGTSFKIDYAFQVGNSVHGYVLCLGRRNSGPGTNILQGLGVMVQGSELGIYYPSGQSYNFASLTHFGFDLVPITEDIWYHVRMDVDPGRWNGLSWDVEPGFDLYLDDVLVGTDLPWNIDTYARQYGLNSVHAWDHRGSLSDGVFIDNVLIYQGEIPAGTVVSDLVDADPDPDIWNAVPLVETGDQTLIQVYNDPDGAFYGNQYVHLEKGITLERYWTFGDGISTILNQDFTVECAMKVGNTVHGARFWAGRRNQEPPGTNLLQALGFGVQGSELCIYYPCGQPAGLCPLQNWGFAQVPIVDVDWHHYRIEAHTGAPPSFDLYFDGELVGSGLPWNIPNYAFEHGLDSVHMGVHSGSLATDASFDNVRLVEGLLSEACDPNDVSTAADVNRDCYVDMVDLTEFSGDWLDCTRPEDPCCSQL